MKKMIFFISLISIIFSFKNFAQDNETKARIIFEKANIAVEEGRYSDAIYNYEEIMSLMGRNPKIIFNCAKASSLIEDDQSANQQALSYLDELFNTEDFKNSDNYLEAIKLKAKIESESEVRIGEQVWAKKNLDVTQYRNGDIIPEVKDLKEWLNLETGAWCYYNNELENGKKYGKLYNWYAVNDPRGLAPNDWHIPTNAEWITLLNHLGGENVAGRKLKAVNGNWLQTEYKGTESDESGFSALPGGERLEPNDDVKQDFSFLEFFGFWWTSTNSSSDYAICKQLGSGLIGVYSFEFPQNYGMSVRCIKGDVHIPEIIFEKDTLTGFDNDYVTFKIGISPYIENASVIKGEVYNMNKEKVLIIDIFPDYNDVPIPASVVKYFNCKFGYLLAPGIYTIEISHKIGINLKNRKIVLEIYSGTK